MDKPSEYTRDYVVLSPDDAVALEVQNMERSLKERWSNTDRIVGLMAEEMNEFNRRTSEVALAEGLTILDAVALRNLMFQPRNDDTLVTVGGEPVAFTMRSPNIIELHDYHTGNLTVTYKTPMNTDLPAWAPQYQHERSLNQVKLKKQRAAAKAAKVSRKQNRRKK